MTLRLYLYCRDEALLRVLFDEINAVFEFHHMRESRHALMGILATLLDRLEIGDAEEDIEGLRRLCADAFRSV